MRRHSNRPGTFLLGLALLATATVAPGAFAGEALPDRPGFGYAIEFTTGATAEALLPVERQALPDRPGFGYSIDFMTGPAAEALFPPGWAKQRGMAVVSQD